ncbi:unannotated protein [freshwater metagenome]|uniref:Unannotated protein n=1 Tax=freshwater metagenome TaxID=449393 RepID=A0A6J7AAX0_9ZZZZ
MGVVPPLWSASRRRVESIAVYAVRRVGLSTVRRPREARHPLLPLRRDGAGGAAEGSTSTGDATSSQVRRRIVGLRTRGVFLRGGYGDARHRQG